MYPRARASYSVSLFVSLFFFPKEKQGKEKIPAFNKSGHHHDRVRPKIK